MNAYLRTKTTSVSFLFLVFGFILFFLILSSNKARANPTQEQILNAGINLGWAKATLDFYGDQNPADARMIRASLNRAARHIQAAASLFEEPYQTERRNKGIDQRVIDKINGYFQQGPQLSIRRKASYVNNIWSMYRQSFQTTWDSGQGYHYYPNCDFFILDVGYHFGRAHIAAGVANNNRARSYQNGANGSMRNAIQNGLKVAVDGVEYGTRTNVRKACCCFGKEAFWQRLPTFQWNSPFALYANNLPVLQRIVLDAGVVPKRCTCGNTNTEVSFRPGYYRNTWGDSGYFKSLGGRRYQIQLWQGKKRTPDKHNWYNSGEGTMGEDGLIHSVQPAVNGYPYSEYTFEGYWKITGSGTIELVKYRNYLKKYPPTSKTGGWKSGPVYTLVSK